MEVECGWSGSFLPVATRTGREYMVNWPGLGDSWRVAPDIWKGGQPPAVPAAASATGD